MTLVLNSLSLHNFRNHLSFTVQEPKNLLIIIGENASGKTNIIEALQLVTMTKSFRSPKWPNVVSIDEGEAYIDSKFSQNDRSLDIKMQIGEGKRSYYLNGKKKNVSEICGLIPGVIFIPDDLNLIKSSSEARRDLIDDIGQQLSEKYRLILTDYKKTVKQRNNILKEQKENYIDEKVLESWDENLIVLGAMLYVHRLRLYRKLVDNAADYYQKFSEKEHLSSEYIPSFHFMTEKFDNKELYSLTKEQIEDYLRAALQEVRDDEKVRAKTMVGPHKDEIIFSINGLNARNFASQGQQRSIALALKLGQLALIRKLSGNQPILLLDDVMSELDAHRRTELIKVIDGQILTVITATDLKCFNDEILANAQIIELGPK